VTELLLVRHGETDWNAELRVQGHADPSLNERGREQARALAASLADETIDAVYSSDLARARETAEIVAEALGLGVHLDAGLREFDTGNWTGLTRDEIRARFPDQERHDGETRGQLVARVGSALGRICQRHPGQRVLVVTHGGALRWTLHHAGGELVERVENCAVYRLALPDGDFTPLTRTGG
jgi:broad specificity phosphatase PhoE